MTTPAHLAAGSAGSSSAPAAGEATGGGAPRPARFEWYDFTAASGEPGRRWVEAYRSGATDRVRADLDRVLRLCHRRRLAEADELLADCDRRIRAGYDESDPTPFVLWRYRHGTAAYHRYVGGAFEEAATLSRAAAAAVGEAIDRARFLLPLAHHCHEFELQQARVARNRRRWEEVAGHLARVAAMLDGREPYCVLADGTRIDSAELFRFCWSCPDLSDEQRHFVRYYQRGERRQALLEEFAARLYASAGPVVPYR